MLKDEPNLALLDWQRLGVASIEPQMPDIGEFETGKNAQQRRLTRARRAEQPEKFALGYRQVDAIEHRRGAEPLTRPAISICTVHS